jgi:hypothetical protein
VPAGGYTRAGGRVYACRRADIRVPAGGYPRAGGQINVLPTKGSQGKLDEMDTSRTDDVNTDKTDGPT